MLLILCSFKMPWEKKSFEVARLWHPWATCLSVWTAYNPRTFRQKSFRLQQSSGFFNSSKIFCWGKRKIHFCHIYHLILTLHILKHLQFHQLSGLLGHFLSLISIIWDKRNQFLSTLNGTQGTVFISILCPFAPTFVAFPSKGRQFSWEFTVNTFFLWQTHIRIRFHI